MKHGLLVSKFSEEEYTQLWRNTHDEYLSRHPEFSTSRECIMFDIINRDIRKHHPELEDFDIYYETRNLPLPNSHLCYESCFWQACEALKLVKKRMEEKNGQREMV